MYMVHVHSVHQQTKKQSNITMRGLALRKGFGSGSRAERAKGFWGHFVQSRAIQIACY